MATSKNKQSECKVDGLTVGYTNETFNKIKIYIENMRQYEVMCSTKALFIDSRVNCLFCYP